MGTNVQELVKEDGALRGVRYRSTNGDWHTVRAQLTVGAAGRFSRLRRLVKLQPHTSQPPVDALWFRLPRRSDDPADAGATLRVGHGRMLVLLDHYTYWQAGYVIQKASYQQLPAAGLEVSRQAAGELIPWAQGQLDYVADRKDVAVLSVGADRLAQGYMPSLVLIGDAANIMSRLAGSVLTMAFKTRSWQQMSWPAGQGGHAAARSSGYCSASTRMANTCHPSLSSPNPASHCRTRTQH